MEKKEKTKPTKKRVLMYYLILAACILIIAAVTIAVVFSVNGANNDLIENPGNQGQVDDDKNDGKNDGGNQDSGDDAKDTSSAYEFIVPIREVDLAKAHVCAVTRMIGDRMKQEYEIFNIGTGKPLSVLDLINTFEQVNGVKLDWQFAPRRAGDVTAIWADPTLAQQELGWQAERSIGDTLAAAWAWEKRLAEL